MVSCSISDCSFSEGITPLSLGLHILPIIDKGDFDRFVLYRISRYLIEESYTQCIIIIWILYTIYYNNMNQVYTCTYQYNYVFQYLVQIQWKAGSTLLKRMKGIIIHNNYIVSLYLLTSWDMFAFSWMYWHMANPTLTFSLVCNSTENSGRTDPEL